MTTDMKEYMALRRKTRRARLIELAGSNCVKCDSSEKLNFDHIDSSTKKFSLTGAALDKKWETILEELDKCQLLCEACHKEKTVECVDHNGGHNKLSVLDFKHGTVRMYQYGSCKCDLCKLAKKKYRNKEITIDEVVS
jgi:hypothetical protein